MLLVPEVGDLHRAMCQAFFFQRRHIVSNDFHPAGQVMIGLREDTCFRRNIFNPKTVATADYKPVNVIGDICCNII